MEGLGLSFEFWRGRRVFITGHTGFKGSWLSLWLARHGAALTGYALEPDAGRSLFREARVDAVFERSVAGDVRDLKALSSALSTAAPDVVIHLAAQALVRRGYAEPIQTFETNVIGTANLLEAIRPVDSVKAVVVVTTDKCYRDRNWDWPYREQDELGGHDPYAASKACAELVTSCWRDSYLRGRAGVATARAGNVIGGGDWSTDRLLPDIIRACEAGTPVELRHPAAVRPWQHVLDPLRGYLLLAERLVSNPDSFSDAFNFGPDDCDRATVGEIAQAVVTRMGTGDVISRPQPSAPRETAVLRVDSSRARAALDWKPQLSLRSAVEWTADWYRAHASGSDDLHVTMEQISKYEERLRAAVPLL